MIERLPLHSPDEQIATALFEDLRSSEVRDILPLGMINRSMTIAMWYGRGVIQLGAYDAGRDLLSVQDLSPQEAVTFLAPEETPNARVMSVAEALSEMVAKDLVVNGEQYEQERRDTADRIFSLPLREDDETRMRHLLESSGTADVDEKITTLKGFKG